MAWQPGETVLGLYEVKDVRSGGMGVVHRVRHLGWQVDLAVKTPRPEWMTTPADRRHFEREAGTWVNLGLHPHTVNCVYVRTIDATPRVFAEWVDGGSLAEAVAKGRLDDPASILDIAIQTAWGLAHAHEAGLVHQDVKPANVMLEPDGTVKVTDFGLAKALQTDEEAPAGVSFAGRTREYCSPEQADAMAGRPGVRITAATDVWSWAVTVLEMFAGRRPTNFGEAAGEALTTLLDEGLPMPAKVVALLRTCFADDPEQRPTALDVAAQLIDLYGDVVGTAYGRQAPKPARLLADGLSNQALSLLDLGRVEEAEELWQRAVGADPYHLPSVYNQGLHKWRTGSRTGEEVVSDLEAASSADPANSLGPLLLGAVQLERHENERAGELLRKAAAADPSSMDAQTALAALDNRPPRIAIDLEHEGVTAVALSADGQQVLFGDKKGRLVLWTPAKGTGRRAQHVLTRRGDPVQAVAMSADATVGAIIRQGAVELWDLARRRQRPGLRDAGGVCAVAVSADGSHYATGQVSGLVSVWTVEHERQVAAMRAHAGRIDSLALSPDGRRVVSASFRDRDSSVRAWDVATNSLTAALSGPQRGTLHGVPKYSSELDIGAVSLDASHAVVAWWHGPLTTWDTRNGVVVSEVPTRYADIYTMVVAGTTMMTTYEPPVRVFDAPTGRCLRVVGRDLKPDAQFVKAAAITADARVAALASDYAGIALRSLPAADYQAPWCYARPRAAHELVSTEDTFRSRMDRVKELVEREQFAAAGEVLRTIREVPGFARNHEVREAWARLGPHGTRSRLLGGWFLYEYAADGEFTQPPVVLLRQDGRYSVSCRWTGEVDVWDFLAAERLLTFDRGEGGMARDVRFAVDGLLVLVLTTAGTIRQLNLADGGKRIFTKDTGRLTAFDVDATGTGIVIGDETGTLRVRDLPRGNVLAEMKAFPGRIHTVAMSPDGRHVAALGSTGGDENEIHVWAGEPPGPTWTLKSRSADEGLRFSPDGRLLFVSFGLSTGVWDAATGEFRHSVRCGTSLIGPQQRLALSGDGRLAATPGEKGLSVWRTDTGEVHRSLPVPDLIQAYVLSADGTFAVTANNARQIQVWDLRTGGCLREMEGHRADIHRMMLSDDGGKLLTTDIGSSMCGWELVWDYDFR
ncbi:serine/threonine-protein kinase [Kutzneria kofuensis]|uniref:WD40 repeat protein/serine/threonine protein kinase n=1 Tax=Kutzneria kofuensis TaxID=103725 RepID=A0A7W9NKS4_9PSEU|nr:serine/threonine-protein kinase [Kutzneria kofuensis]MBB5896004.1 WD40 repeat protein/serine/threonine protein kinase [Kutzneria kofuensis]